MKVVSRAVPALPPMLRAKLERLEIWLFFSMGNADVVEGADGDEDEGQGHHLQDAPLGCCAIRGHQVEAGEVVTPQAVQK